MSQNPSWLQWAVELQSLAQAGLTYGRDSYDKERYTRLREIAAEILASHTELPIERVRAIFCNESGYQTPKLDTRAAIFQDGKILLVEERNGTWSLPGGWCDVNCSVSENTVKEVREEAGLEVKAVRMIAVQDYAKHNVPVSIYGICKTFILCDLIGGAFRENIETLSSAWFSEDALPTLAQEKNTEAQIRMCFDALRAGERWQTLFD